MGGCLLKSQTRHVFVLRLWRLRLVGGPRAAVHLDLDEGAGVHAHEPQHPVQVHLRRQSHGDGRDNTKTPADEPGVSSQRPTEYLGGASNNGEGPHDRGVGGGDCMGTDMKHKG